MWKEPTDPPLPCECYSYANANKGYKITLGTFAPLIIINVASSANRFEMFSSSFFDLTMIVRSSRWGKKILFEINKLDL